MSPKPTRHEAGTLRIRAAMDHVQEAQYEMSRAMQDLSAVRGYGQDVRRLEKVYEKIRQQWYMIERHLRTPPSRKNPEMGALDREPTERDAHPHQNGCGR